MKLFRIDYLLDDDDGSYLTVGEEKDTCEIIRQRELSSDRWRDEDCLWVFVVTEIVEVDGYPILVGDKTGIL